MVNEFGERYRLAAVEAAERDGEARRLEEQKKIIFSELVNRSNAPSVAKQEHEARASQTYKDHIDKMVIARTIANVKQAEVKAMDLQFEAWRTREATNRAKAQLR